MPTCAHIHQTAVVVDGRSRAVTSCPSCGRVLFRCPACGEMNRPLARFCRACRYRIHFADAARQEHSLDYEYLGAFPLPSDAGVVRGLKSYAGHLFIITENALLVYDVYNLYNLLRRVTLPGEKLQDVTVNEAGEEIQLLLTSNRGVYSFSLLDLGLNQPPAHLSAVTGAHSVYHRALSCGGNVYWLEYDSASNNSELHSLPAGRVATYPGRVHPPVRLDDNRLLVVSAEQLFLYDGGGSLLSSSELTDEGVAEPVNMGCQPALDEERKIVYLVGARGLWSAALDGGGLAMQRMHLKPTGEERLAVAEDNVFVARADGFYILDTFGTVKWKADPIYIPEDTSDGTPPQVDGKYCVFSGLKGRGSDLRVYSVNNPNRYSRGITVESPLACAPLLTLGRVMLAVGAEGGGQETRVYKLKEPA